ncbi:MAG TPA: hypothetical protein VFG72_11620 [Marmoricola sp.]|nr:hypothetical protein [Marmoricola sp.]
MWGRGKKAAVPASLVTQIEGALVRVDVGRAQLDRFTGIGAPLPDRRRAHAELRAAYLDADALLRAATRSAKAHSRLEWSGWRHRLSQLDFARQQHLFEESDDPAVLALGCVRAVDTGMSGPAIGDLLHGRAKAPGAPAEYGVDLEAVLTAPAENRVATPAPSVTPIRAGAAPSGGATRNRTVDAA